MTAVNVDVAPLPLFDCTGDPTSVTPRWKRWKKAFQFYIDGKGVQNNDQKKALLLHSAGMDVQDIFETLNNVPFVSTFEGETDNVYKQAMRNLDAYFAPKGNVPYERHVFRSLKQDTSETVDQYVSRLKKQALNCDFGNEDIRNEMIRDQVIDACKSNHLRKKLLQKGDDLTLETVLEMARALEAVDIQSRHMDKSSEVNHLTRSKSPKHVPQHMGKPHTTDGIPSGKTCYRCGQRGHISKDPKCPAHNAECRKCGHVGHWASVCKTKAQKGRNNPRNTGGAGKSRTNSGRVNQVETNSDNEYAFIIGDDNNHDSGLIDVNIGGVFIRCLIDSGSTANVVDQDTWTFLKKQRIRAVSERATKRLYLYGAKEPLTSVGKFSATVEVGDRQTEAEFIVIECKGRSILCKETAEKLGLLKVGLNVCAMSTDKLTLEDIQKRYHNVCTGIAS